VKNPDEDDRGKLKRVLKYLNGTRYLKLRLTVENMGMLKWYGDGSHNVHWDCKGHGGAVFTLGKGATSNYTRKVKLNTRSSTETELLTADMNMPEMLWSLHFIQVQGNEAECVGLYQNNISTQLLIKNGKMSSGKMTKHIKAKFFFIKDRVDNGDIRVIDCPTEVMWVDIMTKPLQGTAFRVMRAELMNCPVNYEDPSEEEATETKRTQPISALRMVTWKSDVASSFKTPQECVGQDGSRMVRMSTHRAKKGVDVRQTKMPESPYVQHSRAGTARVARANERWRREHARGKK
jgi:hypothetical protein